MRKSAILAAVLVVACTDHDPIAPDRTAPVASISDAAHESGNAHFQFLPPMVPTPVTNGAFDPSLAPVVQICQWSVAGCTTVLAEFTRTGPGSETVRLAMAEELYLVNWHTDQFSIDTATTYRIRVLVAGTELGHADVAVVAGTRGVRNINTGQFVPLVDGRTLPIKFRIERGAVFVVGPAGGTVVAADGQVALEVPPGATGDLGITVTPSAPPAGTVGLLPGTVFDFGPEGTTFAEPVRLRIAYDEASLPPGLSEADLTLLTEHDGLWQELPGEVVDANANVVSAFATGFSKKGVGGKVGSVEIDPTSATLSVCATQQFTANVRAPDGTPLTGRQVVWSSSDNAIAIVDKNGVARGAAAGTAMIIAASGGEADSATMTVVATPGVTSCTNIVEIDARALSAPQFSVSGVGTFSTTVVTALSLPAGEYALDASDGRVLFTVTLTGTVDFATTLDGVLSGRGTTRLSVMGHAITFDATALSAPRFQVGGVGDFPRSTLHVLRLLPNLATQPFDAAFGAYRLDAADGRTLFAVRDAGVLDYPSRLDPVQSGRGTSQLTVTGYAITFDATALSAPRFQVGGVGDFSKSVPTTLRLLPNIPGAPPGSGFSQYALDAADGRTLFVVQDGGVLDYPSRLDPVQTGRETGQLTVTGYAIGFDATTLSAPRFQVGGIGDFSRSAPTSLRLLPNIPGAPPGSGFSQYALDAADGRTLFVVQDGGVLDYPTRLDQVQSGRGTGQLRVAGYAITFDATALSAPRFQVGGVGDFTTATPRQLQLLPNIPGAPPGSGFSQYTLDAADGRTLFVVRDGGLLDYPSRLDPVQTGRGTAQLIVAGYSITFGASALSAPRFQVRGVGDFPTSVTQLLRLLPNIPGAPPGSGFSAYAVGASDGRVVLSVRDGGIVSYDATLEGILLGQGTSALNVRGAPVTIDATALRAAQFSVGGVGTFTSSAPQPMRLLPSIDALHAYGFSSTVFSFPFVVTTPGTFDYDPSLDSQVSGRGTALLTVSSLAPLSWSLDFDHVVQLEGLWVAGATSAVAVGDSIVRYDGSSWRYESSPVPEYWVGVWGSRGTDMFVVGASGMLIHYDGISWTEQARMSTFVVLGISGSSGQDVYAVGQRADLRGAVFRYDGVQWSQVLDRPTVPNAVWAGSADNIYVVGDNGSVLHFDGTTWTDTQLPGGGRLTAVWGSSAHDVYAAGSTLWHFDGDHWAIVNVGLTCDNSFGKAPVWGTAPRDVYFACGNRVMHFDGAGWTVSLDVAFLKKGNGFHALAGTSNGVVFAATRSGEIYRGTR